MLTAKKIAHELMRYDFPWADPINNQGALDQGNIRDIIEKYDGFRSDGNNASDHLDVIEYGNA
jgi:hypothetical protein